MVTILSAIFSIFEFRVRSRISLELELIALRHQVTVLRRQRPGRPRLSSLDRMLWVWLYRICPQVIDTMVLVKPVTVVQWHHKGFRLYWRWRSRRPGRPKIGTEECGRNLKNAGYVLKAARANAVGALLVFLHLLESDATDEIAAFMATRDGLALAKAFKEIDRTKNGTAAQRPSAISLN